jgi:hypothetical protein
MIRAFVVALGLALSLGTVLAQPAAKKRPPAPAPTPAPTPAPAPDAGSGSGSAAGTTEKADTSETLQTGGTDRPWATGVPADRQQTALRLFQEGNVQLNDGIFAKAVETYREALKSWDHPAIHYNMALALMNLDQPIEVEQSLQKSITFGPAPLEKDKFEHAKEYLLLIAKQLAEVDVSCDKVGAKVSLDGQEVFTVEPGKPNRYQGRVRIGKHQFVAEKKGYNAQIDAPFIEPGQKFRIELTLYTAEELTRYKRKWNARWMPYAVIGGGVALGLAGGALQLSASSSYRDFDAKIAKCNTDNNNGGCDATAAGITDLRDSGDTKRTLGYVGYGLAGAAVVTGAVLVYLNRETSYEITAEEYRREKSRPVTAAHGRRRPASLQVGPLVTPGVAGAIMLGSF